VVLRLGRQISGVLIATPTGYHFDEYLSSQTDEGPAVIIVGLPVGTGSRLTRPLDHGISPGLDVRRLHEFLHGPADERLREWPVNAVQGDGFGHDIDAGFVFVRWLERCET